MTMQMPLPSLLISQTVNAATGTSVSSSKHPNGSKENLKRDAAGFVPCGIKSISSGGLVCDSSGRQVPVEVECSRPKITRCGKLVGTTSTKSTVMSKPTPLIVNKPTSVAVNKPVQIEVPVSTVSTISTASSLTSQSVSQSHITGPAAPQQKKITIPVTEVYTTIPLQTTVVVQPKTVMAQPTSIVAQSTTIAAQPTTFAAQPVSSAVQPLTSFLRRLDVTTRVLPAVLGSTQIVSRECSSDVKKNMMEASTREYIGQVESDQQESSAESKIPLDTQIWRTTDVNEGDYVGRDVDVFSNSCGAWLPGVITETGEGNTVCVNFRAPDERVMEKWMPLDHPHLKVSYTVVPHTTILNNKSCNDLDSTMLLSHGATLDSISDVPEDEREDSIPTSDQLTLAAKADEANLAAQLAEEATATLLEENEALRARCEELEAQMRHEQDHREDMSTITARINNALARLGTYELAAAQSSPQESRVSPKEIERFPPEEEVPDVNPPRTSSVQAPFSSCLSSGSVVLSEDGYTVLRTSTSSSSVTIGSALLEPQVGGWYFEVMIKDVLDKALGGLAIGITETAPDTLQHVPETVEDIPLTAAVGFDGSVYFNGVERHIAWSAEHVDVLQCIGLLVTDDGSGDMIVFEDQKPVVRIDGASLSDAGLLTNPVYPVVQLYGRTASVSLVPNPEMPFMASWHHLESVKLSMPLLDDEADDMLQATQFIAEKAPVDMLQATQMVERIPNDILQATQMVERSPRFLSPDLLQQTMPVHGSIDK